MGHVSSDTAQQLHGRAVERAAIETALDRVLGARASVLVFKGGPGAGKTSMLAALRDAAARHGLRTRSARGHTDERHIELGVVAQLVDDPDINRAMGRRTMFVGDAWAGALAPGHLLHRALGRLTAAGPLVLCIDDAHLADAESLSALAHVVSRLYGLPLVVAIAAEYRLRVSWDDLVLQAAAHEWSHIDELRSLDTSEVAALVHHRLERAGPDDAVTLHRITAGIPLLVCACIDAMRAGTPVGHLLTRPPDLVRRRAAAILRSLPDDARALAEVASVADDAPLPVLAALAGLDHARFAAAVDVLLDRAVVRDRELHFAADLLQVALQAALRGARRQLLHTVTARALEQIGAPSTVVARHLLDAGPSGQEWVVEVLRDVARQAGAAGDNARAVDLLRRALREHPAREARVEVLAELALAEAALGDPAALEHAETAQRILDDPAGSALLLHDIGRGLLAAGEHRLAADAFWTGLRQPVERNHKLLHAAGLLAATRLHPDLRPQARRHVRSLVADLDTPLTDGARAALSEVAIEMLLRNEPVDAVVRAANQAMPRTLTSDDPALLAVTGVLAHAGKPEVAIAALDAALGTATPLVAAGLRFRRAQSAFMLGALVDARSDAEAALAAASLGWRQFLPGAHALLAAVCLELGDADRALELVDAGNEFEDGYEHSMLTLFLDVRARVRVSRGLLTDALADFHAAGTLASDAFGCDNPSMLAWRSGAAVASHRLGDAAGARRLIDSELRDASRFGEPRALARALRISGRLRGGERGLDEIREALRLVEASPARLEHAWTLADLGAALRRAGRLGAAIPPLRRAADLAARLDAAMLGARVADQLRLAGSRPRRTHLHGPLALTPGEVRVAERAAAGATNRKIAAELYISVKAVEFHLRNAYAKLGIRSRRDLRAALAGVADAEARD